MSTLDPTSREQIRAIVADFKNEPGPLLLVLHAVQETFRCIPEGAIPLIADELNLSRAEVHGVMSFYHYFRGTPPGRHTVRVCRAEACQSMGANALAEHIQSRLGVRFNETSADGAFTLEPIYCFGNCACSPAVMIDEELYGRMTAARFDELIAGKERRS